MKSYRIEFFSDAESPASTYTVIAKSYEEAAVKHSFNVQLKTAQVYAIMSTGRKMFNYEQGGFRVVELVKIGPGHYMDGFSKTFKIRIVTPGEVGLLTGGINHEHI